MMQSSYISVKPPRSISLDDRFDAEVIEFSLDDLQNSRDKGFFAKCADKFESWKNSFFA